MSRALADLTRTGAILLRLGLGLGLGFGGAVVFCAVAGCGNERSAGRSDQEEDTRGALEGELSAVSILAADGNSSMDYTLRVAGSAQPVRLVFDADPALTSETTIRVWGAEDGAAFRVLRHEVLDTQISIGEAPRRAALIGQAATTRTVAWVQMDVNGGGVNQTKADASRLIFDQNAGPLFGTRAGDRSVVQYYDEVSYGMLKLTGQVEGPIPFSGTACNNFDPLARDVSGKVTALGRTYDHYYLYWGSMQNCGPGWGAQGTHSRPGRYVWLNNNGTFCTATGQEIGHNFGLMHASTMDCGTAVMANDTSSCTSSEYGNPMTVMGGGCRHLISIEKWYSGFFLGCNAIKVKTSASFTLLPIETPCNGIQALQIPMAAGAPTRTTTTSQSNGPVTVRFYYLELRSSVGLDTGLRAGVYVHVAPDIPAPTANGPRTFLLDMNPATTAFDPMTAGQTFTDPAGGVSFTLDSVDATRASVRVEIQGGAGDNACVDGTALIGAGPDTCGTGPATGTGGAGGATTGTGAGGAGGAGSGSTTGAGGAGGAGGRATTTGAGGAGVGGSPGGGSGMIADAGVSTTGAGGSRGSGGAGPSTGGPGGPGGTPGGGGLVRPDGGGGPPGQDVVGGCSCDIHSEAEGGGRLRGAPSVALLLAGFGIIARRRRKQKR